MVRWDQDHRKARNYNLDGIASRICDITLRSCVLSSKHMRYHTKMSCNSLYMYNKKCVLEGFHHSMVLNRVSARFLCSLKSRQLVGLILRHLLSSEDWSTNYIFGLHRLFTGRNSLLGHRKERKPLWSKRPGVSVLWHDPQLLSFRVKFDAHHQR